MGIAPLNVPCDYHPCLLKVSFADRASDRDCALTLGWIQTLLTTAILQLPEDTANMSTKIDAVSAINKVRERPGSRCNRILTASCPGLLDTE